MADLTMPTALDEPTAATHEDEGEGQSEVEVDAGYAPEAGDAGDASGSDGGESANDEPSRRVRTTTEVPTSDHFVDESRYMRDETGLMLLKWKVEYGARGGGGRAMCKDLDCLEQHSQGGLRTIEKGDLRIGRRVLMEKDDAAGAVMMMWYHARCIFNTFLRARKTTRVLESAEDLEGFESIAPEDQAMIRRIIAGNEDVRGARVRSTPQKRGATDDLDSSPASKRLKEKGKQVQVLRKGDRVWTFCKIRPPASDRPGVMMDVAMKSPKPELGMIAEEEQDGGLIIQFESAEHEKERNDKLLEKRYTKIRGWLRYPRVFEGKKQRIPVNWIQMSRRPPILCSCTKQVWGHQCDCGIACSRGTSTQVWGVCQ